jgi:GntR family transcriptional regulator/MocR family aminotransferase
MLIPLTLARDQPLQQQLYDQLKGLIASARLRSGLRMPSTRVLAEQFAISRNTVLLTYERLVAEGYLETLPAKGTFVGRRPAWRQASLVEPQAPFEGSPCGGPPFEGTTFEGPGRAAPSTEVRVAEARVGRPDPSLFPAGRWRALMRGALDRLGAQLGSEHPAGSPALRNAIAGWLSTSRGLAVASDQVILVSGRQQALHIIARVALRRGMRAVVEDPCDANAAAALAGEAVELVRVPVDIDGLRTDCLPAGDVALVHVTPEHQRPLGVTLARGRRIALLAWAERIGALVLEEDCEGELRYGDMNVPSLMSLDTEGRVIMLGGFCTSLGPWLGLAYMVLPRRLIAGALAAQRLIDDSRRFLEETALTELLGSGGYARHLHRLGKAYASRRDALLTALRRHFGTPATTWGEHAGLHLAWFPPADTGSPGYLAALARRCGLEAAALPAETRGRLPQLQAVLLGFGALSEPQIASRVAQFAALAQATSPAVALSAD